MLKHVHHRLRLRIVCLWLSLTCMAISCSVARADDAIYPHGVVAADHPLASQAGLEMLQKGGNAVDAAVATSFCLSVVRPFSCGLGGGGFMLIHQSSRPGEPGWTRALNYRETCPAGVGPDFYAALDDKDASKFGWKASGVPGSVAGLCYALKQYGKLDLKTVLQPAIRAAEEGFAADAAFIEAMNEAARQMEKHPQLREAMGVIWTDLCREGRTQLGDVVRNPDQAKALRLIAEQGPAAFYDGPIARAIAGDMKSHGGTLTLADLAGYQVREVQPLRGEFRGHILLSMPPPSSGGIAMQQIFGILAVRNTDLGATALNSPDYVHLVSEAMKHAFADRSRWLADPAFAQVPVEALISFGYLESRAKLIDMGAIAPPAAYGFEPPASQTPATAPEDHGTSHLCALDKDGMAVACTETINLEFGSMVCVPGFGFCLNNEMDDFTTIRGQANAFGLRQSDANLPQPGKRPLSSMSPTIVTRGGRVTLVAGGSGGPRIISATTQCILNVLMFGMTPEQAVSAPRFHHQWMPNKLLFDSRWTDEAVIAELQRRGHEAGELKDESAVQLIAVDAQGNIRAASDPRKGGAPAGH